jgi:hypothetical protein
MFNKLVSVVGLLHISSSLAATLGTNKSMAIIAMNLVLLCYAVKSNLVVKNTGLSGGFVVQKFEPSCCFRCKQIHNNHCHEFGKICLSC